MAFSLEENSSLEIIAEKILETDQFVIGGHVSPDGDCIGSELALWAALISIGKQAVCVSASDEPLPYALRFLPGADKIIPASQFEGPFDAYISVDVSDGKRFGNGLNLFEYAAHTFIIDHHACTERLAQYSYIDPDSPSASMIVWRLIKLLCEKPPAESALCAYTGLVTDTGSFRYQNATADAFETASELVAYGVDPSSVATHVFQNQSLAALRLEGVALDHMVVFADGEGVLTSITLKDLERYDATKSDTENIINTMRSLRGIRVACTLREQDDCIKGSLRAKDDTDVAELARTLNGGGHKAAAGFTLFMSMEEAIPFMQQKITELIAKQDA